MRTLPGAGEGRREGGRKGRALAPDPPDPAFARATAATAATVLAGATLGLLWLRHWGRVPFSVPSLPYYFAFPFYVFPHPRLDLRWAPAALPLALAAAAGVVALARSELRWAARLALSCPLAALLALAVAALEDGPRAWWGPFDYAGEYPAGVAAVGSVPTFLRHFPAVLPGLPTHAQGHPAGAMVFYALVARVHPGLVAAALATVAVGSLGALAAGVLARDELGEGGGRLALALWALSPGVVLYLATSADAVFAAVLAGAAVAARRGLLRRSLGWTLAGGALLWAASMLTYAAVLLLVFLLVTALGRVRDEPARVLGWAALTAAAVLALAAAAWLLTGYDPVAAVRASQRAYQAAPGSAGRQPWPWVPGDLLAFGGMLGVPLLAALVARTVAVVRERAWTSLDAAAAATLLAASSWGFSKGEVERIFQFLVPLVLVAAVRQLQAWRVRLPVVAALLLAQTLAVQVLFATRW
jgi:methylthioxylose transferase